MLAAFWRELAVGYQAFERTHRVPDVSVDATGAYCVRTHVP
jgi:murein L,D-transpeptidase YafK